MTDSNLDEDEFSFDGEEVTKHRKKDFLSHKDRLKYGLHEQDILQDIHQGQYNYTLPPDQRISRSPTY